MKSPPSSQSAAWEAYRARDDKLTREVALKVLPAELATLPQ
jgi:hypothetical protein